MIIDSMKMCNIGVYKGSHGIQLSPESGDRKITLIGGVNGAGKTSLLNALQIGIFGINSTINRDTKSYHKLIRQKISHGQNKACIDIKFRQIAGGQETTYNVKRKFDIISESKICEKVCVFEDKKKNDFLSNNWDMQANRFFPYRLRNLFIFDGEKISSYSSNSEMQNFIENSFRILFGLDNIEQLSKDLDYYSVQKQKSLVGKETVSEVEELEECVDTVKKEITRLRQEKASIRSHKIDETSLLLKEVESRYEEAGGEFLDRKTDILNRVQREKEETVDLEKRLIAVAAKETPLILIESLLHRTYELSDMEERKRYGISKEAIIKERDIHLINLLRETKIPKDQIEELRRRLATEYEYPEPDKFVSVTKVDVVTLKVLEHLTKHGLPRAKQEASRLVEDMRTQRAKLRLAIDEKDCLPEEGVIGKLLDERNKLKLRLETYNKEYKSCDDKILGLTKTRDAMLVELKELLRENLDLIHHKQDIDRIMVHVQKVKDTLELLRKKLIIESGNEATKEMMLTLKALCHNTLAIESITVDEANFELNVHSPDRKRIDIETLSAGQRQLFCLAVMWAFKNLSGWLLPVIIDTPFSRLDSVHRENVLGKYLTNVSHQVVILSTDKEVDRGSWEFLKKFLARAYTLKFDNKTQSTSIVPGYFEFEEPRHGNS